jgi:predicted HAD superfamily Cof-like phosphohydrolase
MKWPRRTDYLADVSSFHRAFDLPAPEVPTGHVAPDVRQSREELMREELQELTEAMRAEEVVEIADGLADLLYVVFGTAVVYGIPMDDIFSEVHRSNMTKLGTDGRPVIGEHGKRLKGPDYQPPKLRPLLGR